MSLQLAYCRGLRRVAEGLFEAPSNSAVCHLAAPEFNLTWISGNHFKPFTLK